SLVLSLNSTTTFSIFSYHRPPTHRDLPSSPTRRSSDLLREPLHLDRHGILRSPGPSLAGRQGRVSPAAAASAARGVIQSGRGSRSEEHTSELQSRFDLVCRLLLEKKKKTTTNIRLRQ